MIVLVKITQGTLSNKVKNFIFSKKMFLVLCTPGYRNENSGTQVISFHLPMSLNPVFQCLHARDGHTVFKGSITKYLQTAFPFVFKTGLK